MGNNPNGSNVRQVVMLSAVFYDLEKCAQVGEVTSKAACICVQKIEKHNCYMRQVKETMGLC